MVRKSKKSLFKSEIYQTENEYVKCTKLPEFIRAKKYLGGPFCVYFENHVVPDGVKVTIKASNFKNPNAELKNNQSLVKNGIAEFSDLRFNGKSGRGTKFDVFIIVDTCPPQIVIYPNAIKVTVDGPRPPRPKQKSKFMNLEQIANLTLDETYRSVKRNLKLTDEINSEYILNKKLKENEVSSFTSTSTSPTWSNRFMDTSSSSFSNSCSSFSSSSSSPSISPLPTIVNTFFSLRSSQSVPSQITPAVNSSNLHLLAETASNCFNNNEVNTNNVINTFQRLDSPQNKNLSIYNDSFLNTDLTSNGNIYKDLASKYISFYMDIYKIKIHQDVLDYLVDLILNTISYSQNTNNFLFNFQIFYFKLMQFFNYENGNVTEN